MSDNKDWPEKVYIDTNDSNAKSFCFICYRNNAMSDHVGYTRDDLAFPTWTQEQIDKNRELAEELSRKINPGPMADPPWLDVEKLARAMRAIDMRSIELSNTHVVVRKGFELYKDAAKAIIAELQKGER